MAKTKRSLGGEIAVEGEAYVWRLHHEAHWQPAGGWQGMALAIRHKEGQREAILLFPAPTRANGSPQFERQPVELVTVANGVAAAIVAGWNPLSRGKPVSFDVDADGR